MVQEARDPRNLCHLVTFAQQLNSVMQEAIGRIGETYSFDAGDAFDEVGALLIQADAMTKRLVALYGITNYSAYDVVTTQV